MLKAKECGQQMVFLVSSTGGDAMDISHLLFADDALVFFYADLDQLCHLRSILLCFEAVSGLPINLAKV